MKLKRAGLTPLPAFTGVNIELAPLIIQQLGQLIGEPALAHKPPDVLDCSGGIQPVDVEPAVRRDFDDGCGVAYQLDGVVVKNPDMGLGVFVAVVALCDVHCSIPSIFYFLSLGTISLYHIMGKCQGVFLDVKHLNLKMKLKSPDGP